MSYDPTPVELATATCAGGGSVTIVATGFESYDWYFAANGALVGYNFAADSVADGCEHNFHGDTNACPAAQRMWTSIVPHVAKVALDPALAATVTADGLIAKNCALADEV